MRSVARCTISESTCASARPDGLGRALECDGAGAPRAPVRASGFLRAARIALRVEELPVLVVVLDERLGAAVPLVLQDFAGHRVDHHFGRSLVLEQHLYLVDQ